jgi:hypothetical protein
MPTDDERLVLEAAITRSGRSVRDFAHRIIATDERKVRRWLAGEDRIPTAMSRWLASYAAGEVDVVWRSLD